MHRLKRRRRGDISLGGAMYGVILAGGQASRLGGGDKGEHEVAGATILARVIAALRPQCEGLFINAGGDPARFRRYGLPVLPDRRPDHLGPLAGVLAGLDHVAAIDPRARFVLTAPVDAPFLPLDLAARLEGSRAAAAALISCAHSRGRSHPVVALWSVGLREDLRRYLDDGGRKVGAFVARHPSALAEWPDGPVDPFSNVNTPADLAAANAVDGWADRHGLAAFDPAGGTS